MPARTPFHLIAEACERTGTSVVLIGGQALGAHGYPRLTLDVDFLITEDDFNPLPALLCEAGYREVVRTDVAAKFSSDSEDLIDIDFMFVDPKTFEKIKEEGKEASYEGRLFRIPKLEHLIALKLHAIKQQPKVRELKDLSDIVELIRRNHVDVASEAFKSTCLNFGTPELYQKILGYTQDEG